MKYSLLVLLACALLLAGCAQADEEVLENQTGPEEPVYVSPEEGHPPASLPAELVQPEDLEYVGAFRLPGPSGGSNWGYSGYAAAFYPEGDPYDPDDGFPGSLFAVGHDHHQMVSEISIPVPADSGNLENLNTAATLQPFADINRELFDYLEIPRAGLAYLPPQGGQSSEKLYFAWGQHFEFAHTPTHGWAETDLSCPDPRGLWHVGGYTNYAVNDYMFEIPQEWASANAPGKRLATGRFRDGVWSGLGPALFAIGPWNAGNPPSNGTELDTVPLLLYGEQIEGVPEISINRSRKMEGFSESDEWSGGAWLTSGNKSAVMFVGTKAVGDTWYGFSNRVVYPTSGDPEETYPDVPDWPHDSRGWWSEDIDAQIIFYDPAELAMVAEGELEAWEPQPYAVLSINEYLYDPGFDYGRGKRYSVGAAAFDRENGLLYIFERMAGDDEKSIVHVFRLS
ncbi:hypothetical protein GF318_03240 [Candidatus Micrarchaeota archaeon]|nr:hypothetical protein [Candidatus Micrarchaeota archaeon]